MQDSWLGVDKIKHFTACAGIAGGTALVLPAWLGVAGALLVGALKELWDWFDRRGTSSWRDMAANAAGALAGVILVQVAGF